MIVNKYDDVNSIEVKKYLERHVGKNAHCLVRYMYPDKNGRKYFNAIELYDGVCNRPVRYFYTLLDLNLYLAHIKAKNATVSADKNVIDYTQATNATKCPSCGKLGLLKVYWDNDILVKHEGKIDKMGFIEVTKHCYINKKSKLNKFYQEQKTHSKSIESVFSISTKNHKPY